MTLEEEARRFGVPVLVPCINESGVRYDLARMPDGSLGIRKPLASVDGVSDEVARQIVWCRLSGPYLNVEDLVSRTRLPQDVLDALARSGALDAIAGSSRRALWEIGVLVRRLDKLTPRSDHLLDLPVLTPEDIPDLPELSGAERLSWDYKTHQAARVHPLVLARRALGDMGIPPIQSCFRLLPAFQGKGTTVTVAGIAIVRQRPPTAKGFMFLTLEDETGFLQCIVHPKVQEKFYDTLIQPAMIARGELQATGTWRAMMLTEAWPLEGIFGGYSGFPSSRGNQGRLDTDMSPQTPDPKPQTLSPTSTPMRRTG
jgi:error-prone DNA polymerase